MQQQSDLTDSLGRIRCPVLLIWGDADPISPVAVGEFLNNHISGSELYVVPQGQHDLAEVYTDEVARMLLSFASKYGL